jgi:hypothetical protein
MEGSLADEAQAEYYIKAEHGESGLRLYRARKRQPFSDALADARALWAVRVLDAWAVEGSEGAETASHTTCRKPVGTWWCSTWEGYEGDDDSQDYKADSPDAARLAAAEAVFPSLPAEVRETLGERP